MMMCKDKEGEKRERKTKRLINYQVQRKMKIKRERCSERGKEKNDG